MIGFTVNALSLQGFMDASARRVASRYLSAAPVRLDPEVVRTVNVALVKAGMDGNSPFRSTSLSINRIGEVLASHDLGLSGLNSAAVRANDGETSARVVSLNSEGMARLTASKLIIQWVTDASETVKVVAYLS